MQATIQVLLKEGKSKLTTTRVAQRAGVSVGTLYQYFPNKSSLLQALLKQHLDGVALAIETACEAAHGKPLAWMAEAVIAAFVQAKFHNIDASVALYAVSDDLEGKRIAGHHALSRPQGHDLDARDRTGQANFRLRISRCNPPQRHGRSQSIHARYRSYAHDHGHHGKRTHYYGSRLS